MKAKRSKQTTSTELKPRVRSRKRRRNESIPSLEDLPDTILDQIFELVQSPDLVKLASLSKSLYWPAARRIYKRITIYQYMPEIYDGEKVYDVSDKSHWLMNYGTAIKTDNSDQLEETLSGNPRLAALVESLSVICEIIAHPLSGIVTQCPNLREVHDWGTHVKPKDVPMGLRILTYPAEDTLKLSSNLVELNVVDYFESDRVLENLARDFITLGSHVNLRKLLFSTYDTTDYELDPLKLPNPETDRPSWIVFVKTIADAKVTLNLTSLGLCGMLEGREMITADLLQQCINLPVLKMLVLNDMSTSELDDTRKSFAEILTSFTSLLESLTLFPTRRVMSKDLASIESILSINLKDQLKELCILYCAEKGEQKRERYDLLNIILSSQRNLVKLKIEDGWGLVPEPSIELRNFVLEVVRLYMGNDWYMERKRSELFPRILDTYHRQPVIGEMATATLKLFKNSIYKTLQEDLLYVNAIVCLPLLTQYYIGGVFIDMKRQGLFINGETICFRAKPDKVATYDGKYVLS